MFYLASILDYRIRLVAPINGVTVGDLNNKVTWVIDFKPEATTEQRAAGQAVIDNFNIATEEAALQAIRNRQLVAKSEAELAAQLRNLTPQQAVDYIQNNVNDLPTAKAALKIMARLIVALWDYTFPNHHSDDPPGMGSTPLPPTAAT